MPNQVPLPPPLGGIEGEVDEDGERVSPRRGRHKFLNQETHPDGKEQPQNSCCDYIQRKYPHGLTGKRMIDVEKNANISTQNCAGSLR